MPQIPRPSGRSSLTDRLIRFVTCVAGPAVARTLDGGRTWTVFHNTYRILQMTFGDRTHGYALDVTGINNVNGILSTSDGGATWQRVTVPVVPDLRLTSAA